MKKNKDILEKEVKVEVNDGFLKMEVKESILKDIIYQEYMKLSKEIKESNLKDIIYPEHLKILKEKKGNFTHGSEEMEIRNISTPLSKNPYDFVIEYKRIEKDIESLQQGYKRLLVEVGKLQEDYGFTRKTAKRCFVLEFEGYKLDIESKRRSLKEKARELFSLNKFCIKLD